MYILKVVSNDSFLGHWHLFTGTEAEVEADGVAEVTKQLEKQAIEDKEKEEEGEEGDWSQTSTLTCGGVDRSNVNIGFSSCFF